MSANTQDTDPIARFVPAFTELTDRLAQIGGCTDGGCQIVRPKGMHTNGGCKCLMDKQTARRVVWAYQRFVKAIADELEALATKVTP